MTLAQLTAWKGNIPHPEYESLLKKIEAKKRAIRKAHDTVYDEDDSLSILKDEQGSERWQRHDRRRQNALKRIEKLKKELATLEETLACA